MRNKNRDEAVEPDAIVKAPPKRIKEVVDAIDDIRKSVAKDFLKLADLLIEFTEGGYHLSQGYSKFGEWLAVSGLDLSERAAYYLMQISKMGKVLGIPRRELEKMKLSKLREISRIDFDKPSEQRKILKLLEKITPDKDGNEMSLDDVRESVAKIIGGGEDTDDIDVMVYITIRIPKSVKENTIEPALEAAKSAYGDTINKEGEPIEISPGKAFECICADYLAGIRTEPEEKIPVEGEVIDAEVIATEPLLLTEGNGQPDETEEELALEVNEIGKAIVEPPNDPVIPVGVVEKASKAVDSAETYSNTESVAETKLRELKEEMAAKKVPVIVATETPSTEDKQEDDPVYQEVYSYLEANPEASSKLLMTRFRIGEVRADRLRKYIAAQFADTGELTISDDETSESDSSLSHRYIA